MAMGKVWSPVAALGCAALLFSQLVRAEDAPAKPGAAQTLPPAPGAIVPATPVKAGSGSPLDLSAACATPTCPAPTPPLPSCSPSWPATLPRAGRSPSWA